MKLRTIIATHLTAVALSGVMLAGAPEALAQATNSDPALQQVVDDSERIAPLGEKAVISAGHADLGPL